MNRKYFILLALAGLLATLGVPTGCDDDIRSPQPIIEIPLPALTVDKDTLDVDAAGGIYTVNVTCDSAWIAYNDATLFPWITVSAGNATGNGSFTITAVELPFTIAERTAPVTIRLPGSTKLYREVVVRQVEPEPELELINLPTGLIDINGDEIPVEILSNAQWTVDIPGDINWVRISPAEGARTCTAMLTVDDNSNGHAKRLAVLTFRAGASRKSFPFTVYQDGAAVALSVNHNFPPEISTTGSTYTINITTNAAWSIASNEEWCGFNPESGDGDGTVTVTVAANDLPKLRASSITVTAFDEPEPIGIRQAASEPYIIKNGLKWLKLNIIEDGQIPTEMTLGKVYKYEDLGKACPPGWRIPTVREWAYLSWHWQHESWENLWAFHDGTVIIPEYGVTGMYFDSEGSTPTLNTHVFLPFTHDYKTVTFYAGTTSQYLGIKIGPDSWEPTITWCGADAQTEGIMEKNGQRVRCVQAE
jgi:hypothetical protein